MTDGVSGKSTTNQAETEESVVAWCNEHYGDEDTLRRYMHLLEEVTELGSALGVPVQEQIRIVSVAAARSQKDFGKPAEVPGEAADVQVCLWHVADGLGISIASAVTEKMVPNRARSKEEMAARFARKRAQGL